LTDNRQIEPAGEVAENVSGPGQSRCLEPRFDRDLRPPRHLLEPGHGCVGSLLGERALLVDKVHRQSTSHQGRWQHRFIGKRHRGKVRAESLGDRNRVFDGDVLLAVGGKMQHDILDHAVAFPKVSGLMPLVY
jgi:hypothetical protein